MVGLLLFQILLLGISGSQGQDCECEPCKYVEDSNGEYAGAWNLVEKASQQCPRKNGLLGLGCLYSQGNVNMCFCDPGNFTYNFDCGPGYGSSEEGCGGVDCSDSNHCARPCYCSNDTKKCINGSTTELTERQCRISFCENIGDCDQGCTRCQIYGLHGVCEGYESTTTTELAAMVSELNGGGITKAVCLGACKGGAQAFEDHICDQAPPILQTVCHYLVHHFTQGACDTFCNKWFPPAE